MAAPPMELMDPTTRADRFAALLVPGRNCWRIEKAQRLAFLIDGEAYFAAVRAAIARAQQQRFHPRLGHRQPHAARARRRERRLARGARRFPERGRQARAATCRCTCCRGISRWSSRWIANGCRSTSSTGARTGGFTSGSTTSIRSARRTTRRSWSSTTPSRSSAGSISRIAAGTRPSTRATNPGRCDPDGKPYRPYHDVQVIVDGAAARALGELCRDRWSRVSTARAARERRHGAAERSVAAGRRSPKSPTSTSRSAAPIRATRPDGRSRRSGTSTSTRSARRSARCISRTSTSARASSAPRSPTRLREPRRARHRRRLAPHRGRLARGAHDGRAARAAAQAARGGRRRRPLSPATTRTCPASRRRNLLNVHSKVLVVDDELVSVGSANFSNRSMGFDTECNVAIEARGDERIRRVIASLRNRLLARAPRHRPRNGGR